MVLVCDLFSLVGCVVVGAVVGCVVDDCVVVEGILLKAVW